MGLTNLTTYLNRGYNPVTKYHGHPSTVDGSEIRQAPVEVGSSHYLQGFSTIPGRISEPSTVSRWCTTLSVP